MKQQTDKMSFATLFNSKTDSEFLRNAVMLLVDEPQQFDRVVRKLRKQRMPFCTGNITHLIENVGDGYRELKKHSGTELEMKKYIEEALVHKRPNHWRDIVFQRGSTVRFSRKVLART